MFFTSDPVRVFTDVGWFYFRKKCTVWIQIKIELTTFLIIRLLIIFDKLSPSNYPLTNSVFQPEHANTVGTCTQRMVSMRRFFWALNAILKCWNNIMLDFLLSRPMSREDPNQAAHLQYWYGWTWKNTALKSLEETEKMTRPDQKAHLTIPSPTALFGEAVLFLNHWGCAGWSAHLLFAKPRMTVFSHRGPYYVEH